MPLILGALVLTLLPALIALVLTWQARVRTLALPRRVGAD